MARHKKFILGCVRQLNQLNGILDITQHTSQYIPKQTVYTSPPFDSVDSIIDALESVLSVSSDLPDSVNWDAFLAESPQAKEVSTINPEQDAGASVAQRYFENCVKVPKGSQWNSFATQIKKLSTQALKAASKGTS